MTTAIETAKERLDAVNAQMNELREQQVQNQRLYASYVSAADGEGMGTCRLEAITLDERLTALTLQAQQLLIEDAQERLVDYGRQQEAVQEDLHKLAGPLQAAGARYAELQTQQRALEARRDDLQRQCVEAQSYAENAQRSLAVMQAEATRRW